MEKKPITWITKNGKHIPIYDEPSEDEKKKEREIAGNEKEATEKNKTIYEENGITLNGKPGVYNLFRSGNLDAPNGMVFLATERKNAEYYGDAGRDTDTYQLDIKKPLIIDAGGDVEAVQKAWRTLHPDKELKLGRGLETKWTKLDKENSTALHKSDYDAIMYRINGKVKEVQIPGKQKDRLKHVETKLFPSTVTMNDTLPKAREVAHKINEAGGTKKSKEDIIKDVIKTVDTSKYDVEYKGYMDSIIVTPKSGEGLQKSRGTFYMQVVMTPNGRVFVKGTGGRS